VISQRTRTLLKNKDFLYLWANQILTQVAFNLVVFSLLIWVFKLTGVNIAVSFWWLATIIPSAVLSVFAGVIADNYDRGRVMIATNLLWALAVLAYIFAKESFVAILIITAAAQGIDEFFGPAQVATLPQLVAKEDLLAANSFFSLSLYASTAVGFVLAGPLLRFFGFEAPFIFAAILALVGAGFVSRLSLAKPKESRIPLGRSVISHFWQEMRGGISFLLQKPLISGVAMFAAVLTVGGIGAATVAPGFMEQGLKIDAEDISLVCGVPLSLGLILGTILLRKHPWSKWRNKKLVGRGLLVLGFTALVLAAVPVLQFYFTNHLMNHIDLPQAFERLPGVSLVAGLLIFILGAAVTFIIIPTFTFLQRATPNEMRGRLFGFLNTAVAIFQGFSTLIFGGVADLISPSPLIAVVGVAALVLSFAREKLLRWALLYLDRSALSGDS
jgi:DHA3 family macrolide efflux protein-like MFS transporter